MTLERREQIEEEACFKLLPWAWGRPRITSLLRSYARECQLVEDACHLLFQNADVDTADSVRLVLLGKLIGQARHGLSIAQLRVAIKARALANRSQGTLADIFAVLNAILPSTDYSVVELGSAQLLITALDPITDADVDVVQEVLPFARAGGVGLHFGYSTDADVFLWGDPWGTPEEWGTVVVL